MTVDSEVAPSVSRRRSTMDSVTSATPPLMTDDDSSSTSFSTKTPTPSRSLSPIMAASVSNLSGGTISTPTQTTDRAFEEYLIYSRRVPRSDVLPADETAWTWDRLKPPVFQAWYHQEEEDGPSDDASDTDTESVSPARPSHPTFRLFPVEAHELAISES
jgi:hypothetical protein